MPDVCLWFIYQLATLDWMMRLRCNRGTLGCNDTCSLIIKLADMERAEQVWFGMKLTPEQKEKIKRLAEREGTSAKEAVLRAIDEALGMEIPPARPGSFLEGIEDLVGSVGTEEGPVDLASNPKHMDGFGQ